MAVKRRFGTARTQSMPVPVEVAPKLIFDRTEEAPVPFADIAHVQLAAGFAIITFGRVAIPFELTSEQIKERAAKQGMHVTVVARIAVNIDTANALARVLAEVPKQQEILLERKTATESKSAPRPTNNEGQQR